MQLTNKGVIKSLISAMGQMTTFADMMTLYSLNRSLLKDWTFIVSTSETDNMDLYSGMNKTEGIKERLFTPFTNGRVSVINDKIYNRCIKQNDSRARIYRCVSFDTQTVSYIERYYRNGSAPYDGFDSVIHMLKEEFIGIDYIPYTLENLMFDSNNKDSVNQTLLAFEMLCSENRGNEKACKKRVKSILSLYDKINHQVSFFPKNLYNEVYLSLLKMCQIQLKHPKSSLDKKLNKFINFMNTELCRILQPELNLAKLYFSTGNSCGFFGKIQVGNKNIITHLRNMTWDLFHLRFMCYSSTLFDNKKCDASIPYFFTYDKRLQDVRRCYDLQLLATNTKDGSVVPIYNLSKEVYNIMTPHCTLEKHQERLLVEPNIDSLISNLEHEIINLK